MKRFIQIIFTFAVVIGLAFSVSAQKDDQKKPPPKGNPPVIDPGKKPPRGNPPKEDKPKKPNAFYLVSDNRKNQMV